jgi:hypothetical protein
MKRYLKKLTLGTIVTIATLTACQNPPAESQLSGEANNGGRLELIKTYDRTIAADPRLQKAQEIDYLNYRFRDSTFSEFLAEHLSDPSNQLSCGLPRFKLNERRSLITKVTENRDGTFTLEAADLKCASAS